MTEAQHRNPQQGRELTPQQQQAYTIQNFLKSRQGAFRELLPRHLTPEKMVRGVLSAATRNPRILECTTQSILNCVIVSSTFGLPIGAPRGGMHIVPFRNKGRMEATPIPDYRGLMDLAYRSGMVAGIVARPVYEGDDFDYEFGTSEFIHHKPKEQTTNLTHVYAVAWMKDEKARPVFWVLTKQQVDGYRNRSKAKADGPWVTDYEAMALKTAIKRLTNVLPQAPELEHLHRAVDFDERVETGQGVADLFDGAIEVSGEPVQEEPSRTDKLKETIGGVQQPVSEATNRQKPAPQAEHPSQPEYGRAENPTTGGQPHEQVPADVGEAADHEDDGPSDAELAKPPEPAPQVYPMGRQAWEYMGAAAEDGRTYVESCWAKYHDTWEQNAKDDADWQKVQDVHRAWAAWEAQYGKTPKGKAEKTER